MRADALGNPPTYCDHKPPKVSTVRVDGKVQVQCLTCGTVGPERESPGEAFLALLRVPYRANRSSIGRDCVTANRRMYGSRGAAAVHTTVGLEPLL